MSTRIDAIKAKKVTLDNEKEIKARTIKAKNDAAIAKIKGFADDLHELYEIAEAMTENGFPLGKTHYLEHTPEFVSNGWSHRIGFLQTFDIHTRKSFLNGCLGRVNGGAFGNVDLEIDLDGNIISYGEIYSDGTMVDVLRFANEFSTFKEAFLAYVDRVTA